MKIFVTKTISQKILLHLVTIFRHKKNFLLLYLVTEKFVAKTNFLFLFFHVFDINL